MTSETPGPGVPIDAIIVDRALDPQEKSAALGAHDPGKVVAAVHAGLIKTFEAENWAGFDGYVNVAGDFPSPRYLPVLVTALDSARSNPYIYALNIVYALSDLALPGSVPVLARTVAWHREHDVDDDLAVNALDALLHIDTPESRAVLAAAVDDDREAVRELAEQVAANPQDFW